MMQVVVYGMEVTLNSGAKGGSHEQRFIIYEWKTGRVKRGKIRCVSSESFKKCLENVFENSTFMLSCESPQ